MEGQNLSSDYILELFNVAMKDRNVFEVLREHLKYSYLTHEHEKKFWKKCLQFYRLNEKPPSYGLIQIEFKRDGEVKEFISDIKSVDDVDKESVIGAFQEFIKESKFVELFEESGRLYNSGEQTKAYSIFTKGAEELANFSIRDRMFDKVFEDYEEREIQRVSGDTSRRKVPFMIDMLDKVSFGGPETGETVLFTAESGVGKSQALVHYAVQTARRGGRVAFFQIEGTKRQAMDRIDASWTGAFYHDVKNGNIEESRGKKIKKVLEKIRGEIYVVAYESFDSGTTYDIRNSLREMRKLYGEFDLVCIDYMELITLGDGQKYGAGDERFRQQKIGRFIKELAMEEDVVGATATQASNLPAELKKDPNFVMTREYLSEDKGKIRPFDFHFTFNQTFDEYKNVDEKGNDAPIMRIYVDKMREHKSGQVCQIVTNYSRSRFYDRNKTLRLLDYEDDE